MLRLYHHRLYLASRFARSSAFLAAMNSDADMSAYAFLVLPDVPESGLTGGGVLDGSGGCIRLASLMPAAMGGSDAISYARAGLRPSK